MRPSIAPGRFLLALLLVGSSIGVWARYRPPAAEEENTLGWSCQDCEHLVGWLDVWLTSHKYPTSKARVIEGWKTFSLSIACKMAEYKSDSCCKRQTTCANMLWEHGVKPYGPPYRIDSYACCKALAKCK